MPNRNLGKEVELVKFQGDDLPAYRETVSGKEIVRVNVRAVCVALGLSSKQQLVRIREDPILAEGSSRSAKQTPSGTQESIFLDVECLPLWLAQIHLGRVKEESRDKLIAYRREVKTVLYEYFLGKGFSINERIADPEEVLKAAQEFHRGQHWKLMHKNKYSPGWHSQGEKSHRIDDLAEYAWKHDMNLFWESRSGKLPSWARR